MGVAEAAIAAAAQRDFAAGLIEIGEHCFLVVGHDLGADRNADMHVRRGAPGAVAACAIAALGRAEMLRVAEIDQRVEVGHGFENDVAAAAAISAIRAAELHVLLAAERDYTVPAIAGTHVDLGLV